MVLLNSMAVSIKVIVGLADFELKAIESTEVEMIEVELAGKIKSIKF